MCIHFGHSITEGGMCATAVGALCLVAAITSMSSLTTPGTGFSPLACFTAMTKFLALEAAKVGPKLHIFVYTIR